MSKLRFLFSNNGHGKKSIGHVFESVQGVSGSACLVGLSTSHLLFNKGTIFFFFARRLDVSICYVTTRANFLSIGVKSETSHSKGALHNHWANPQG